MPDLEIRDNSSDSRRFYELGVQDLQDREPWTNDIEYLRRLRMGARKKSTAYPGAPNWVDPIIDDNVNQLTAIEFNIFKSPKNFATFIPLSPIANEFAPKIELAFNMLLGMTDHEDELNIRIDQLNENGMAIAALNVDNKAFRRHNIDINGGIPYAIARDPIDMIIPTGTQKMEDALRLTEIYRLPPDMFREEARVRGWNIEGRNLNLREGKGRFQGMSPTDRRSGRARLIGLADVPDSENYIIVWRTYGFDRRMQPIQVWYLAEDPDEPLLQKSWTWNDDNTPRPWPFFQLRAENRNHDFYDTRGVSHMLKDNQLAANQFLNLKGIHYDYIGKPMLQRESGFVGNIQNVRWNPGEVLEGVKPVQMPSVDQQFNFEAGLERERAARRVGSMQNSMSGVNPKRDRITAREVTQNSLNAQTINVVSVQRMARQETRILQAFWEYLRHNPVPLPVIDNGEMQEVLGPEVYKLPFIVQSSVASRHADPLFKLTQLNMLQNFIVNNPFVGMDEIGDYALNLIDPILADRAVTKGQPGIMSMLEQLAQQVQGIKEVLGTHNEIFESMERELEKNQQEAA